MLSEYDMIESPFQRWKYLIQPRTAKDEVKRKENVRTMDYLDWAREYRENAQRVKTVIERRYRQLKDDGLTADSRKRLNDELQAYRKIYYELTRTCALLTERAKADSGDA